MNKHLLRTVVLVRLANANNNWTSPPIGIGYLMKALLVVEGINPVFIDCKLDNIDNEKLLSKLRDLNPLLIGFQLFSADYSMFVNLLPQIKQHIPESRCVAGGPHISGLPNHTLETNPDLDYAITGEAEEALPHLVRYLLAEDNHQVIEEIPNLVHRKNGSIIHNAQKWIDVNEWDAPAWSVIRPDLYPPIQHGVFHKSKKVVPILTSRGCPYPCTFCAGNLVTGKKIRLRNIKSVVDEIEWLQNTYHFGEFIIEDENFTFHKSHVLAFADEIKNRNIKCHFSFPNGVRLDKLDEEIISRLAEMGTYNVVLGLESGSRETLTKMGKHWDFDEVRRKINLLHKYGILASGSFIVGYRDETMEDINKTIKYALSLPLNAAYFGNYLPLPGTKDFEILLHKGEIALDKIKWENYNSYTGELPYHPKDLSQKEFRRALKMVYLKFYLRPTIAIGMLKRMTNPVLIRSFISRFFGIFSRK